MAKEYTPTTAEIRDLWRKTRRDYRPTIGTEENEAAFERWLESVTHDAWRQGWDEAKEDEA